MIGRIIPLREAMNGMSFHIMSSNHIMRYSELHNTITVFKGRWEFATHKELIEVLKTASHCVICPNPMTKLKEIKNVPKGNEFYIVANNTGFVCTKDDNDYKFTIAYVEGAKSDIIGIVFKDLDGRQEEDFEFGEQFSIVETGTNFHTKCVKTAPFGEKGFVTVGGLTNKDIGNYIVLEPD